jgi:hypothetical protein
MDKLNCAQSVAITRGRRWVSFESRIDTNDDSALLGLIECDEETAMGAGWQSGVTLCDWTTFDGLVTAAHWSFAGMTVDSSRDRWAYGTPGGLGIVPVAPTVTFGGQTIYFDTINTAQVGLNPDDGPSASHRSSPSSSRQEIPWASSHGLQAYSPPLHLGSRAARECLMGSLEACGNHASLRCAAITSWLSPFISASRERIPARGS